MNLVVFPIFNDYKYQPGTNLNSQTTKEAYIMFRCTLECSGKYYKTCWLCTHNLYIDLFHNMCIHVHTN